MGTSVAKWTRNKKDYKIAFLTREDLNRQYKDMPMEDVSVFVFMGTALSREDINTCDLILFRDGGRTKVLKKTTEVLTFS
jgi:hypothetical protein